MRSDLIGRVRDLLARSGFYVSEDSAMRPVSFDLLARRDGQLLVIKVLRNVDAFGEAAAEEMKVLARFLSGTTLLVGERSSSRELEPGAVYERHGVRILNFDTLSDLLTEGIPPLVYAAPGGFYVTIDGARLREIREERGLSLGQLAEAAGVSRRAISMYEEGMGAMVDVAERLEAFLAEAIVEPVDPFRAASPEDAPARQREAVVDLDRLREGLEREVAAMMMGMGFRVVALGKAPMSAISAPGDAPRERPILTGFMNAPADLQKARVLANLSEVAETYGAFFVERRATTRVVIEGTPLIGKDELARMDDPQKVVDLIRERRLKPR